MSSTGKSAPLPVNWASTQTPFATRSRAERFHKLQAVGSVRRRSLHRVHSSHSRSTSAPARHAHLPDDSRPRLQRQRGAVAAYRCPLASAVPRTVSATPNVSRRASASRLGPLWAGDGGPRQASLVLLRDDSVVFQSFVSGVLLRSNHGELPARPRARVRILARTTASDSLRQSQKCRAGAPRQSDPVPPQADRVERALSLRPTALPGARGQSERTRGTSHPLCPRFVLGGPDLYHAGRMQSPGLTLARSGRAPTALAWRRRPHGRRCLRRRTVPLAASCAARLLHRPDRDRTLAARPSMCASISTITPSRRKRSDVN